MTKVERWLLILLAALGVAALVASFFRPAPASRPATNVVEVVVEPAELLDPSPERDAYSPTYLEPAEVSSAPSALPLEANVWTETKDLTPLIGEWEGKARGPLPSVKIGKPNAERKFEKQPPDFNVKFRIPLESGVFEGGCDVYASGLAYCRVHDPVDKANYDVGVKRDGILKAEVNGMDLRLTIPNGVDAELVRKRPSASSLPL